MSYEFRRRRRSTVEAESGRPGRSRTSRPDANFLPLNAADNLGHLGLASAMIVLGIIGIRARGGEQALTDGFAPIEWVTTPALR